MITTRNIFIYWCGPEYNLISIFRDLIDLHSRNGRGYTLNIISDKNIKKYIKNIPEYFSKLSYPHQADFVRVNVICDFGGIWLDSDTLVLDSLDSLFDLIDQKNGFFIKENNECLCNGIFGSKPNSPIMNEWKNEMMIILDDKQEKINWTDIGSTILKNLYDKNSHLFNDYEIFNGLDNLYPINWNNCVNEFIEKPYDNYKNIIREYQPLVVLVNSVYKKIAYMTKSEILKGNMPINYFINKSLNNITCKNISNNNAT